MKRSSPSIAMKGFLMVIVLLVVGPTPSFQNEYCRISTQHTLCKFNGVGAKCGIPYEIGIPSDDRELIMEMHNSYRSQVATGQEMRGRPGPQPTAANMKQLVWDEELAATAQRLADQCKYTHDCLECRKVSRFLTGQNLYQFSENIRRPNSNWKQAIDVWYNEVAQWNPNNINYFHFIKPLGHYTQMLWADTNRLGCGYAYFNEGKWNRKLYICNYGPAGNIITTPMYQNGAPCSACPQGTTCSLVFPGLCTESSSSAIVFPTEAHFRSPSHRVSPRPTITTTQTPSPSTKQTTAFNEIETNDLWNFEKRGNFPMRQTHHFQITFQTKQQQTRGNDVQSEDYQSEVRAHVSRSSQSPVEGVSDMNSILIFCDFDYAKCPIRFTGEPWNYTQTNTAFSRAFGTSLLPQQLTNLYIRSIMASEDDGRICLSFRFIKYSTENPSSAVSPLRVTAGSLRQLPTVVSIKEQSASTEDWLTANVQFDNLKSNFLLIFQMPRNRGHAMVTLAIDDILVTRGLCK